MCVCGVYRLRSHSGAPYRLIGAPSCQREFVLYDNNVNIDTCYTYRLGSRTFLTFRMRCVSKRISFELAHFVTNRNKKPQLARFSLGILLLLEWIASGNAFSRRTSKLISPHNTTIVTSPKSFSTKLLVEVSMLFDANVAECGVGRVS
jgi:hypothetical protein